MNGEWKDKESGKAIKSCTMIITEPNKFVTKVHDRMPVLLSPDKFEPWLSGKAGTDVLKPAPERMLQMWPVSKRVNSSRADGDDATLIDKVAA
jgi:putative SOS response-associated peptidase YedK